jgi:DNA-directed RNA polymerase subunit alpha
MVSNEPQTLTLKVKGVKDVTAGDIKTQGGVEILNPELHIATLTDKNAELNMEITVEKGLGFVPKEVLQKNRVDIGSITVDAIFTPVRRVSYEVENMRVGDRTDYNRLRMILETDGSQTPSEVLSQSIRIMLEQFKSILDLKEFVIPEVRTVSEIGSVSSTDDSADSADNGDDSKVDLTDVLKTRIDSIQLSTRTLNALSEAGIRTVGGLIQKTEKDLLDLDGFGDKALKELKEVLNDFGLALKK